MRTKLQTQKKEAHYPYQGYFSVQGQLAGLVHARVGQIVLKCNVFKTIFVRPTETRVEGHEAARWGRGRP